MKLRTAARANASHTDATGTKKNEYPDPPAEILVGIRIREVRNKRGLSLRMLAAKSGLSINTLSLLENGKSSPSVGTLQQLARALNIPLAALFDSELASQRVVFTRQESRAEAIFGQTHMENLGKGLTGKAVQPFLVTLEATAGSGEHEIVHTGYEFVYCLSGTVRYTIDGVKYTLQPGDSLLFQSHLPHHWENIASSESKIILVLYPADQDEEPGSRHFKTSPF